MASQMHEISMASELLSY